MAASKPGKPTSDFPLFAHANGHWAKKIKGKLRYFGPWDDPDAALTSYHQFVSETPVPGSNSNRVSSCPKPAKPHPDFPLYAHASGRWAKKIRGKLCYFGPWNDPQGALDKYLEQKDDLLAGRDPQLEGKGLRVDDLVNLLLASKKLLVQTGELQQRTWDQYRTIGKRLVKVFGRTRRVENLRPADFERLRADFAKTHGPTALYNDIGRTRVIFNYAYKQHLIEQPVRYGEGFNKPTRAVMRKARQKNGPRMFKADELRTILDAAGVQMRAMVLLGINCGYGNNDCALLPSAALQLRVGWIDFPRPKTAIPRRCPLWPESMAALKEAIRTRPAPKDVAHADRVFVTKYGNSWEPKSTTDNPISNEMAKLLKKLGLHRPGLGFYALRHTFQTIGGRNRDKDAVRAIMGHVPDVNDMSVVYNEESVGDDRLVAVTDYVRTWLFRQSAQ